MNNPNSPVIITQPSSTTELMMNHDAMTNLYRLAETMAGGKATVPNHLQGNVADCMAVVMQAAIWGMNPFAVAQKTHVVSGTLGYEAQLVNAVVKHSGAVQGAFHYEFFGPWERVIGKFQTKTSSKGNQYQAPAWTQQDEDGLGVIVRNTLAGESEPRELTLLLSQAQVRNSTLWASDPKQQLAYLAVKRWARLYCPEAILGVYSDDELDFTPKEMRDVTPKRTGEGLQQVLDKAEARPNEQQKALPSKKDEFETFLNDCTTIKELEEVGQAMAAADASKQISEEDKNELRAIYRKCKSKITQQIDTETGEITA